MRSLAAFSTAPPRKPRNRPYQQHPTLHPRYAPGAKCGSSLSAPRAPLDVSSPEHRQWVATLASAYAASLARAGRL